MNKDRIEFGKKLKESRLSKGLNQNQLVQLAGIKKSDGMISFWEHGKCSPSSEDIECLEKFFGMSFNSNAPVVKKSSIKSFNRYGKNEVLTGKKVFEICKQKDISVREIADKLKVDVSVVYKWNSSKPRNIPEKYNEQLFLILGIDPNSKKWKDFPFVFNKDNWKWKDEQADENIVKDQREEQIHKAVKFIELPQEPKDQKMRLVVKHLDYDKVEIKDTTTKKFYGVLNKENIRGMVINHNGTFFVTFNGGLTSGNSSGLEETKNFNEYLEQLINKNIRVYEFSKLSDLVNWLEK